MESNANRQSTKSTMHSAQISQLCLPVQISSQSIASSCDVFSLPKIHLKCSRVHLDGSSCIVMVDGWICCYSISVGCAASAAIWNKWCMHDTSVTSTTILRSTNCWSIHLFDILGQRHKWETTTRTICMDNEKLTLIPRPTHTTGATATETKCFAFDKWK